MRACSLSPQAGPVNVDDCYKASPYANFFYTAIDVPGVKHESRFLTAVSSQSFLDSRFFTAVS